MKRITPVKKIVKEFILPIGYWENEFCCLWKNGECLNRFFVNFINDFKGEIGPKILDIGSGDGRHLLPLVKMGFTVTGLELTDAGIETTKKRLTQNNLSAELVKGDFHNIPFPDRSFDTIISVQAFHYNDWAGAVKTFAEAVRVLKPGGLFFFRARSEAGHWRPTDKKIPDKGITRVETRGEKKFVVIVHDFTLEEIEWLAEKNNLKIIGQPVDEDNTQCPGQWNVIFRKEL